MAATSFFGGAFFGGEFFNTPAATTPEGGGGGMGAAGGRWAKKPRRTAIWQGREYFEDDLALHLSLLRAVQESHRKAQEAPEQIEPDKAPVGLSQAPVRAPKQPEPVEFELEPIDLGLPQFAMQIREQVALGEMVLAFAMQRAALEYLAKLEAEDDEAMLILLMAY